MDEIIADIYGNISDELNDDLLDTNIVYDTEKSALSSDTPVYQLRLSYSQETFFAYFKGDIIPAGSMVMVPTRYGKDMAELIGRVRNVSAISVSKISHIDRPASEYDLLRL